MSDPLHWRNDKYTAKMNVKDTRPLGGFVYDESFSLDSELVGPLPSQISAPLINHMLHNKRGGVLALITAPPFVFKGFAPLCTAVPQLLATPGVGRANLLKTPVYEAHKISPVPLWRALWGEDPPILPSTEKHSQASGDEHGVAESLAKRAKMDYR